MFWFFVAGTHDPWAARTFKKIIRVGKVSKCYFNK